MSRAYQLTHGFHLRNIYRAYPNYQSSITRSYLNENHHIHLHKLSTSTHTKISINPIPTTFIRNFCSDHRQQGAFTPSLKKSKNKQTWTNPDEQNANKPQIKKSYKSVSKSTSSRTRTTIKNGKTETTEIKTVQHQTQIKTGENEAKMDFSQQTRRKSEDHADDPSKYSSASTTHTYKRTDFKSPDVSDSHTEISSFSDSFSNPRHSSTKSTQSTTKNPTQNTPNNRPTKPNNIDDIYTVGNPTKEEIEWRIKMRNPNAIIIHPDRLLPVIHEDKYKREKQKIRSWDGFVYRLKSTLMSFSQRIRKNETVQDYSARMKETTTHVTTVWDTSQNYHLVKLRGIIDRLNMQTEASKAMEILQDEFTDFWVEDFLPDFDKLLCPLIVRAYLEEDLAFLETVCIGEAQVFCKNMIEQRAAENKRLSSKILWIDGAMLIETKLHHKKPQLVIRADVQVVDCIYDRNSDEVLEGSPSTIATNVFVLVLEPNIDEKYLETVPLPWQVRSITTARQRQIV